MYNQSWTIIKAKKNVQEEGENCCDYAVFQPNDKY